MELRWLIVSVDGPSPLWSILGRQTSVTIRYVRNNLRHVVLRLVLLAFLLRVSLLRVVLFAWLLRFGARDGKERLASMSKRAQMKTNT